MPFLKILIPEIPVFGGRFKLRNGISTGSVGSQTPKVKFTLLKNFEGTVVLTHIALETLHILFFKPKYPELRLKL